MKITLEQVAQWTIILTGGFALVAGVISKQTAIMDILKEWWFMLPLIAFGAPMAIMLLLTRRTERRKLAGQRAEQIKQLSNQIQGHKEGTDHLLTVSETAGEKIEQLSVQLLEQQEQVTQLSEVAQGNLKITELLFSLSEKSDGDIKEIWGQLLEQQQMVHKTSEAVREMLTHLTQMQKDNMDLISRIVTHIEKPKT